SRQRSEALHFREMGHVRAAPTRLLPTNRQLHSQPTRLNGSAGLGSCSSRVQRSPILDHRRCSGGFVAATSHCGSSPSALNSFNDPACLNELLPSLQYNPAEGRGDFRSSAFVRFSSSVHCL